MFWRWLRALLRWVGVNAFSKSWAVLSLMAVWVIVAWVAWSLGAVDDAGFMKDEWQGAFAVAFLLIPAVCFVGGRVIQKRLAVRQSKRLSSIRRWAAQRNWAKDVLNDDVTLPARGIPFTLGGVHTVMASAGGQHRGRNVMVAYYRVASGTRPDPLTYDFTVVAVGADADFPVTVTAPQRGLSLIKSLVGFQDIDVESVKFNQRWRVVGKDVRGSHAIFSPRVIERLIADDAGRSAVTWDSNAIMVIRDGFSDNWSAVDADLDLLADLAELVPGYMARTGVPALGSASTSTTNIGTVARPRIGTAPGTMWFFVAAMVMGLMAKAVNKAGHGGAAGVLLLVVVAIIGIGGWRNWRYKARMRREWADQVNASQ